MARSLSPLDFVIQLSLRNRLLVTACAALVVAYGGLIFTKLPVDVFPDLNRPTVSVMTEAPGLAPEEVETLVTLPLETVLGGLPGVERVRSSSGVGLSVIAVEFGWQTEIFRNRQVVAEKLALAAEHLPPGITPVMGPIASIMGEIQLLGLSSPDGSQSPLALRTLADWVLRPRLLAIPGVAQVIPIGGGVRQFQILLSARKLQFHGLGLEDVEHNLSHLSQNTTGGFTVLGDRENLIRNIGTLRTREDILHSVVGSHFGKPVLVQDVAEVVEGPQLKRGDGSVNANPAVILSIQKQPGASTIELTRQIDAELTALEKSLPAGVRLDRSLFRQSEFIQAAIHNVEEALRDGSFFVVLVLVIFLVNFRTTLITLTAIPLSLLITAIVLRFAGISINTMTLGGLAIAIGELVDDAVVDVENVLRRLRENAALPAPKPSIQVVFEASSEIRNSIVLATLIVGLVFVPLFFLSGIEGRLFIPLGISYVVSLLASLAVSLTVTPALSSWLLPRLAQAGKHRADGAFVRALKKGDRWLLERLLDHPIPVVATAGALVLGAALLIPRMGRDFLPKFNEGTAVVNVIAQPGISLEASNRLGAQAEKLLLAIPEVKSVARRTGRAELDEHAEGVHYSEIDVDFKAGAGRPREAVFAEMRQTLETIPGVFAGVGQPISHRLDHLLSGVRAQIAIKVVGPELPVLRSLAAQVNQKISGVPGLVDLQTEQQVLIPQVKIQILREEAARFGIVVGDLATRLEMALQGRTVARVLENQRAFDVIMRFDESSRADLDRLRALIVKVMPDGRAVRLGEVADVFESTGPNLISRENMQRRIVVQANASGRDLRAVVSEVQARVAQGVTLPQGYSITYGGQFESQEQASRLIAILGAMSLLAIFLILFTHFDSAFIAFQIMLNIPLALVGSVAAVYWSERVLSVATLVAFITLCGIASRNGIMMISHYLHLMKHEGEVFGRELVIRGSLERLVPVLMTALTAALALIPLALSKGQPGKEILHPVAVVIIGGLLSSTLLDAVVTPVVFYRWGRKSAEKNATHRKEEVLT